MARWRPPTNHKERARRAIRSMNDGSLDGRVVEARPVSLSTGVEIYNTDETYELDSNLGTGDDGNSLDYNWETDAKIVRTLGDQTISLSHIPIDNSIDVFYGGAYIPESNWSMSDESTIVLTDPDNHYHVGRKLSATYVWVEQTEEDVDLSPVTFDIPGTLVSLGGMTLVGSSGSAISVNDGDTSYIHFNKTGSGFDGYNLDVNFAPTLVAGSLESVSLVTVAKGTDSRSAGDFGSRLIVSDGPPDFNTTLWGNLFPNDSSDWVETVTPLRLELADPIGTLGPGEYVTKSMIEDGVFEYNPGYVLFNDGASGSAWHTYYTYIALRVTYIPSS